MGLITTLREARSERGALLALRRAAVAARRIPAPLAVLHAGRHVGWVHGCACCDRVDVAVDRRHLMPWSTYDDFIAEITGASPKIFSQVFSKAATTAVAGGQFWYDLWPVKGDPPGGGYAGAAYTAVQMNQGTTGGIPIGPDVASDTRHLTHAWAVASQPSGGGPPSLLLYDRVLTYEACSFNANANQGFTNSVAAQRWISAGEPGLLVALTGQTLLGGSASDLTRLAYTDYEGNTGQLMPTTTQVAIQQDAAAPTSALGARVLAIVDSGGGGRTTLFLPLANGDTGVRALEDFTTSVANSGTMCFVLARPMAIIPLNTASVPADLDFVRQMVALNRVYDGACLALFAHTVDNNNFYIQGGFDVAWG